MGSGSSAASPSALDCVSAAGMVASGAEPPKEKTPLRSAAIALLLVAVTGLVHFVVFRAVGSSLRYNEMGYADIAPVAIPGQIKILNSGNNGNGPVVVKNPIVFIQRGDRFTENGRTISLVEIARHPRKDVSISGVSGWVSLNGSIAQVSKPFVGLLQCIFPKYYSSDRNLVNRWRLPIVDKVEIGSEQLILGKSRINYRPDIWPLVANEIIPRLGYGVASQTTLPTSESSSYKEQSGGDLSPKKLFIVMGFVVGLGGLVLLFKVLNKVYLSAGFDVNMAVGGFLLAGLLVVLGMLIVLRSVGLLSVLGHEQYPAPQVSNPAVTGLALLHARVCPTVIVRFLGIVERSSDSAAKLAHIYGPRLIKSISVFNMAIYDKEKLASEYIVEYLLGDRFVGIRIDGGLISGRDYSSTSISRFVPPDLFGVSRTYSKSSVSCNLNTWRFPVIIKMNLHGQMTGVWSQTEQSKLYQYPRRTQALHMAFGRFETELSWFYLRSQQHWRCDWQPQ